MMWSCAMTVFILINLFILTAIMPFLYGSSMISQIEIIDIVHLVYRIIAVIIIYCYAREVQRDSSRTVYYTAVKHTYAR